MRKILNSWLFLSFIFYISFLYSEKERPSSEPFISGDTFRKYSDFILDETSQILKIEDIRCGSTIFVSVNNLKLFFKEYHPKIKEKYILITHNGDLSVPGKFMQYLEDEKLFKWFGQNSDIYEHYKFIHIPIGLENEHWGRGYKIKIETLLNNKNNIEKQYLLYSNFETGTNLRVRSLAYSYFKYMPFCFTQHHKIDLYNYLKEIKNSKFILSPRGNGLDCHRTWEALLLGAIPIIMTSTLDKLYENLPVLIINNWTDITKEFLEDQYIKIQFTKNNTKQLYFKYWYQLIKEAQLLCKQNSL